MWWLLAVSLFVSACNEIYGLDETRVRDTALDDDHDEVPDDRDNCPGLANRDQRDGDADGKGDACDTCDGCFACSVGPDHDEDGDHHVDGCDNCPVVPNPDLANADGDDLGDACDPDNTTNQRRLLFDGFLTIADSWMRIGEWGAANGAARTLDGPHPYGWRLTDARPLLDGTREWRLEAAFVVPAAAEMFDSLGAHIVDAGGTSKWGCTMLFDTGMWTLTNGVPVPLTISPGITTMRLSSRRGGTSTHYCTVLGNAEKANSTGPDTYPLGIQLYATRPTEFAYVEVIGL